MAVVAYLRPEGVPSSQPFWGGGLKPVLPDGYDYDCINTDVLLHRTSVSADGRMVLPDGMSYRVLVLPQLDRMTPETLRKVRELVAGGVTVVGPRAVRSPSLAGYPAADAEVQALAADVWGDLDGVMRIKRYLEKGVVFWGLPLAEVLPAVGVAKDFEASRSLDSDYVWIHRRDGDTDIYFVANHTDHAQHLEARFRVSGKEAELWHPDTGAIEPASYAHRGWAHGRGRCAWPSANRSSVISLRHPASAPSRILARPTESDAARP